MDFSHPLKRHHHFALVFAPLPAAASPPLLAWFVDFPATCFSNCVIFLIIASNSLLETDGHDCLADPQPHQEFVGAMQRRDTVLLEPRISWKSHLLEPPAQTPP